MKRVVDQTKAEDLKETTHERENGIHGLETVSSDAVLLGLHTAGGLETESQVLPAFKCGVSLAPSSVLVCD
jgi:hypothetical protein